MATFRGQPISLGSGTSGAPFWLDLLGLVSSFGGSPMLGLAASTFANQARAERFADEAAGREEQLLGDIGASQEQLQSLAFPSFSFNGQTFGGQKGPNVYNGSTPDYGPLAGGAAFDLNEIFSSGQVGLDAFQRLFPDKDALSITPESIGLPVGIGDARGDAAAAIASGKASIDDLLSSGQRRIGETIDTDLSDVLNANLAGIDAASSIREQQAQQDLAAQSAFFGGLENIQGQQRQVSFDEAQARGQQATTERGQTRALEADLQTESARLSNALSLAAMAETGALSRTEAGLVPELLSQETGRGALLADIQSGNIGRLVDRASREIGFNVAQAQDTQQAGMTGIDLALKQLGFDQSVIDSIMQSDMGVASILAGSGLYGQDPYSFGSSFYPAFLQREAARDMRDQGGQFGLDVGGLSSGLLTGLGAVVGGPPGAAAGAAAGSVVGGGGGGSVFPGQFYTGQGPIFPWG